MVIRKISRITVMKYRYEIIDHKVFEFPIYEDDIWNLQSLQNLILNKNQGWHIDSLKSINPNNQELVRIKKWLIKNHLELLL